MDTFNCLRSEDVGLLLLFFIVVNITTTGGGSIDTWLSRHCEDRSHTLCSKFIYVDNIPVESWRTSLF